MGQDIPNEDWMYQDGDVGYAIRYDDSSEICNIGYDELCKYEVVPNSTTSTTKTSTIPSKTETKAYCKPNGCFNPSCSSDLEGNKKCARCKWANYCCQECQKAHWKDHKKECKDISIHHETMYGREGYKYNKESRKPGPSSWSRWDVKKISGNSLSLQMIVIGKPCIFDPCILDNNPELLDKIKTYYENGKGCSVALERQSDGSDKVVEAYNESI